MDFNWQCMASEQITVGVCAIWLVASCTKYPSYSNNSGSDNRGTTYIEAHQARLGGKGCYKPCYKDVPSLYGIFIICAPNDIINSVQMSKYVTSDPLPHVYVLYGADPVYTGKLFSRTACIQKYMNTETSSYLIATLLITQGTILPHHS